jgi:UDP-N-acetylglucosamine diphosphorylase / glucose-1-phosphate thymidylyltransferase / UDP-N-acetylgalactosamine diphosphorylase / glucosamine-1-phosphate N-acetyltransferase / galactosamine-1-phosphate N-acetyltransferase
MSFATSDCWPLSLTREIEDFPIANASLASHQRRAIGAEAVIVDPRAWLDPAEVSLFLASGKTSLVGPENIPLAWTGAVPGVEDRFIATSSFIIRYPWDLLRANELAVSELRQATINGEIHPAAVIQGVISLGEGSRILPGVFIEGNVVIGDHCKIGPNCYIRGNTSIGHRCHIGQSVEIKNSLILSKSNVGHLSYVGDSVLGEGVNFGAGTTVSNLRHDGKNHQSMVGGRLVDTGRRKFGVIVGDHVHTGIHTAIYPGRKLWPHTSTRPGEIVQRDVLSVA